MTSAESVSSGVTAEPGFGAEVREAVQAVRRAMSESIVSVGLDPRVPLQVAKALDIDKSLSWKVCRIATVADPALVASRLPGRPGMTIVGRALRRAGAAPDLLAALEGAVERFRSVGARHAGDRAALSAMLVGPGDSDGSMESQRRDAFVANSAIWGIRVRTQLRSVFVAPSRTEGKLDAALVSAFVGLERLRNDLPWVISTIALYNDGGSCRPTDTIIPLDATSRSPDGVPLLHEYSSAPLPNLHLVRRQDGSARQMLGEGVVGRSGALDIFTGWMALGELGRYRSPKDQLGWHATSLSTPVETLIHDLFVHRSLAFAMNPRARIHSHLPAGPIFPIDGPDAGVMRIPCSVEHLGSPPDVSTPEIPAYPRVAELPASRLGVPLSEFVGYRLRLKYPPMPAMSVLSHGLDEPPEAAGQQ